MIKNLNLILEALSDADKFATAVAAGGVFTGSIPGNAAAIAKAAGETFTALDSTATAYLAMTENTRYGISKKQSRTVAIDEFGDAVVEAIAYSPMKKANFAALPQAGAALYNGGTMAISKDGKTIYNGDISLHVRFRGKRVSGLIENLRDGKGNLFKYGFGDVLAIRLAEATIASDGSFMKMGERDSQILFLAKPGQPQAITLTDLPDDGNDATDESGSHFAGQFVGKGAAAIGTWAVRKGDNDEQLTGSFGVEKGEDVPETVPTPEGGGVSMASITASAISGTLVSAVDAKAVITLVTADTDTNRKKITVKGADLFDSGGKVIKGASFVADAIKAINKQLERLNAFIAVDGQGDETIADNGRDSVWDDLALALNPVLGGTNGSLIFSGEYAGPNATNDTARDTLAKEKIAAVLDALSTKAKFGAAVKANGTLANGATRIVTGATAVVNAVFDRVATTLTVESGSTKYTRFGVWNRVESANAVTPPAAAQAEPDGLFAYSPLAFTKYATDDPTFPSGGKATYEGTTIARSVNTAASAGVKPNTYFEGTIELAVTWAANAASSDNLGTVTATVSDLRDSKGNLYANVVATQNETVDTIVLGDSVTITRSTDTATVGQLSFTGNPGNSRLRHSDIRLGDDAADSASLSGTFVGKVIDGPLGIIGTWGVTNASSADLEGAYGADLLP